MADTKPLVIKLQGSSRYQRLLSGIPQTSGMRSGLVNLKPQEEIGEHSTENKEEALVILNGEAEILCQGHPAFVVASPSIVYIPAYTKHNVKNVGNEAVRYVYVVTPL